MYFEYAMSKVWIVFLYGRGWWGVLVNARLMEKLEAEVCRFGLYENRHRKYCVAEVF